MDLVKFKQAYQHFEQVEPAILEDVQKFLKQFGPGIDKLFPRFAGAEHEIEAAVDFLSQNSGLAFAKIDSVLSVLDSLSEKMG